MTGAEVRQAVEDAHALERLSKATKMSAQLTPNAVARGHAAELVDELHRAIAERGATFDTLKSLIRHHRFGCGPAVADEEEDPIAGEDTPVERPSRVNMQPPKLPPRDST